MKRPTQPHPARVPHPQPMCSTWWDDAVQVAHMLASVTQLRHTVSWCPAHRVWEIGLADTPRPAQGPVLSLVPGGVS